jgi:hypothetical protein
MWVSIIDRRDHPVRLREIIVADVLKRRRYVIDVSGIG